MKCVRLCSHKRVHTVTLLRQCFYCYFWGGIKRFSSSLSWKPSRNVKEIKSTTRQTWAPVAQRLYRSTAPMELWARWEKPLLSNLVSSSSCLMWCLGVTDHVTALHFLKFLMETTRAPGGREAHFVNAKSAEVPFRVCNISANTYQVREATMPLTIIDPSACTNLYRHD